MSDRYVGPKRLEITHQRYQSLQTPLPEYMVMMSDFVYARPRTEKKDLTFMVMPVNIFAAAGLIGRKVSETSLPIMYGDLRGTMASPIRAKEHSLGAPVKVADKTITYVAYPFILDQDNSGIAAFLRFLEQQEKVSRNLQHVDQAALILGGVEIEKITNPFGGYIYLKSLIIVGPILIECRLHSSA